MMFGEQTIVAIIVANVFPVVAWFSSMVYSIVSIIFVKEVRFPIKSCVKMILSCGHAITIKPVFERSCARVARLTKYKILYRKLFERERFIENKL